MTERDAEPIEGIAWGSDVVAALLRELGIEHAALVPGASYRGLHDSIVNLLGNETPKMLLCLHEEHAVAIAHGWAKVTGEPMLAIVHSNVGLLHASMAVFNAWCDRVPILILGANGPLDAMKRRPFIDWIHTATDMGALIRPFTKWDDQPGSAGAAIESILRAHQLASAAPQAPVYVCLDAAWQEERLHEAPVFPPVARYAPPAPPGPTPAEVGRVLEVLRAAQRPVLLVGRVNRDPAAWDRRVALAETLAARVVTHLRAGAVFPTEHPLFSGHTAQARSRAVLREADAILDLDCIDLAGVLRGAFGGPVAATVVSASLDRYLHRGGSGEHQALPPVDVNLAVAPDALVAALADALGAEAPAADGDAPNAVASRRGALRDEPITMEAFSAGVAGALAAESPCYIRLPRGVQHEDFPFRHPLDFLGADGGGGVGSGPGLGVGAALALRGSERLPVLVTGDGDYLMGVTALWTAVANEIPLLVVVANNRSYYNDEIHQERVALKRGRPPDRRWIGQRLDGPAPDVAALARAQGAVGIGPVERADALPGALDEALRAVRAGQVAVVDVHVTPPASSAAEVPADVGERLT